MLFNFFIWHCDDFRYAWEEVKDSVRRARNIELARHIQMKG